MDDRVVTTHSLTQIIDRMYPGLITKAGVTSMLQTLKKHRRVSLKEIADLILYIADTSHREWNIEVILNSINDVFDSINWRGVYEKFLEEDLKIWNAEYLYTLVDCWVHVSGIITVPFEVFFRRWINRDNQIDFLRILLESDERRTQVYSNIFFEKIVTKEELRLSKYKKSIEYESNLNSVELFKSIKDIEAIGIIEKIAEKSPEYCILGLAAVHPFCLEIFDSLFIKFCEGNSSNLLYHILFTKHKWFMLHTFRRISDRISLTRTLDIFLEHKMLPVVTDLLEPRDLCFNLIILSSRRDHLNLEVWLNNNFNSCSVDFVNYLHSKLLRSGISEKCDSAKIEDERKSEILSIKDEAEEPHTPHDTLCAEMTDVKHNSTEQSDLFLRSDSEIFPFNKTIINSVLKTIENKDLSDESHNKINDIKARLIDTKISDKTACSVHATRFISEIISSQIEIEDSIFKIKEMIKSDEVSQSFVKSIFGLLIDNYSNLYKLPNSDMLAVFFGELIKRRIFFKPFMKVALNLIHNSLKFPESEREHAFAFRILEMFLPENPEFFEEVESIESVRNGLIKKELILIDEDSQTSADLNGILKAILSIDNIEIEDMYTRGSSSVDSSRIGNEIKGFARNDVIDAETILDRMSRISLSEEFAASNIPVNNFITNYTFNTNKPFKLYVFYILRNLEPVNFESFLKFTAMQNVCFREFLIESGFAIVKNSFIYKFESELEFYSNLGSFLGLLILAQNKAVNLETFDFKNFILKSIEYRRITVCVYFVVNLLKQGSKGIICIPNNPWLMSIVDLLSELHTCTLLHIRKVIHELFVHFGIKMQNRPTVRMKEHLIKYNVAYEGIIRQVIASALDFSVREICNKMVKSAVGISRITAIKTFNRLIMAQCIYNNSGGLEDNQLISFSGFIKDDSKRFFLFRNLFVNLTRALIHLSAQEPLKASICGNLTNFLKLSLNDLPIDKIYQIASDNIKTCCSFIEKVAITQVNEIANSVYNTINNNCMFTGLSIDNPATGRVHTDPSYVSLEDKTGVSTNDNYPFNIKIINQSNFTEKTHVRSIENSEYQEIRSFLIQIGRKMPLKKRDYISEEWPLLLGKDREEHFSKMVKFIEAATDRDNQCLCLCKYLVGHALENNCENEFIFKFLIKILQISDRTKREVIGWLLYSSDCKKNNIPFIKKFIEYGLIYLDEFDQALARSLSNLVCDINFVLDLLTILILGDIKYCTVYDFIRTIEILNKMNDNPRVFDFFKKIELGMMKFTEMSDTPFDEALATLKFNAHPDQIRASFKAQYTLNFKAAVKSSWHHFVLYSGSFRFFKIDALALLVKEGLFTHMKDSLVLLVQAYSKRHHLFFMFYCRFFVKVLDHIEDSVENRIIVSKIIEIMAPSSLPGFASQFLEIMNHKFITKFLSRAEAFFYFKDILSVFEADPDYESLVTQFFIKNNNYSKKYNLYLSYICPENSPTLKNLFNQSKSRAYVEKGTSPYFSTFYCLSKYTKTNADYNILIDNLNENNPTTALVIDKLNAMINKGISRNEIVLTLLIRSHAPHVPAGLTLACTELLGKKECKSIVDHYTAIFFKKGNSPIKIE